MDEKVLHVSDKECVATVPDELVTLSVQHSKNRIRAFVSAPVGVVKTMGPY